MTAIGCGCGEMGLPEGGHLAMCGCKEPIRGEEDCCALKGVE